MNFVAAGTRLPLNFRDCRQTLRPGEACGTGKGPKIQTLPLTAAATTQQPNNPTARLAGWQVSCCLSGCQYRAERIGGTMKPSSWMAVEIYLKGNII